MKKTILVTIEKELEIDIPDHMLTPEYRAEFENGLHKYQNDEHLFHFAAEMISQYGSGEYEGLGLIGVASSEYPRVPDVKFTVNWESVETEVEEAA